MEQVMNSRTKEIPENIVKEEITPLTKEFLIKKIKSAEKNNVGNINRTLILASEDGTRYILQMINKNVFKNPEEVMQNIRRVSRYLEREVLQEGGNPKREVLHPIQTIDGACYIVDKNGNYWRMYDCIENAITYDEVDSVEKAYKAGEAFGRFLKRLSNFPAEKLHEAIPDFHNTPKRFVDFENAILADKAGRLRESAKNPENPLKEAIEYIIKNKEELRLIELGKLSGALPTRVTHNDTKINNVMIDKDTGEAICVIDLDTVAPDSMLVDFGDAIRSGCNKAGEEPENIEDAKLDIDLFEGYVKGYLSETANCLTKGEIENLHKAPRILTMELAMRFITDYLNGDEYFQLKPGQPLDFNLKRGLVQLNLAKDMAEKEKEMAEIVAREVTREDMHKTTPTVSDDYVL